MTQQQQLDRRITIQSRTVVLDPTFGGETVTWVDLDTVWASFRPRTAGETFRTDSNIIQASNTAAFRIRWRDDLDETMRVVFEGEWDIGVYCQ